MELLEEYEELIERDSAEISFFWKAAQIFLYFLCAITGYVCSALFYIFWYDDFGGNCPLWARVNVLQRTSDEMDDFFDANDVIKSSPKDWRRSIVVHYDYENRCKMYFVTSLSSCTFGVVWFTLFSMCGPGGYDKRMQVVIIHDKVIPTAIDNVELIYRYISPWRIVLPALIFNFILSMMTMHSTIDMVSGYLKFSKDLKRFVFEISDMHTIKADLRECEIVQLYTEIYNSDKHDLCSMLSGIQVLSRIMMWSWIGGLVLLILRVIMITDFRLLKVSIYEVPDNDVTIPVKTIATDQTKTHRDQKEKED